MWLMGMLALLAGCSSEAESPRITAATDAVPERRPDFNDSAELEAAVASFGECVEQSFPIVIRFRADPFDGMSTEVASQREEDGERVDSVTAECKAQLELERRLSAYQAEHPMSAVERRRLVDDFVSCVRTMSPEVSSLVTEANLDSETAMADFLPNSIRTNSLKRSSSA